MEARSVANRRSPGEMQVAKRMLARATESAPAYVPAHVMRAHYHLSAASRYFELPRQAARHAEAAARQALSLSPERDALAVLGWVDVVIKGRAEGLKLLHRAVALAPRSPLLRYYRGWALAGLGNFDDAIPDMGLANELAPMSASLLGAYGFVLLCGNEVTRCHELLRRAVKDVPGADTAFCVLSMASNVLGRHNEAVGFARMGADLSGDQPMMKIQLGYALAKAGDMTQAVSILDELNSGKPHRTSPSLLAPLERIAGDDFHRAQPPRSRTGRRMSSPSSIEIRPAASQLRVEMLHKFDSKTEILLW